VAKFKSFEFETANVKAKVTPTEMSAEADGKLESVWVRVHRFPTFARKVEVVMEIGYLVGDPEEVDLSSLNKPGPVRIRIACVDATKIRGESTVFFNGESYNLRWELEGAHQETSKSTSKFEKRIDGGEEDEEEEEREFGNDNNNGAFAQKEGGGDTSTNNKGYKASGGYLTKYHQKQMEMGQEEGFGVVEDGGAEHLKGGADNMEVNNKVDTETSKEVPITNESELPIVQEEILTQQSATAVNTEDGGLEEELVDYDEDPMVAEKLAMAELEKRWNNALKSWSKKLLSIYRVRRMYCRGNLELAVTILQRGLKMRK
jgi:hypothetical protein